MPRVFPVYGPISETSPANMGADVQNLPERFDVEGGTFHISHRFLAGGPSDRVDCLHVTGNNIDFIVIPSRGMGIWKAHRNGIRFGWDSPTKGPIHPSHVPIDEPSGIGWLDGFDELLVRCGLESNGAPEFDSQGKLRYPLHGRIANTPAHTLSVTIDESLGLLEINGIVREARLFFTNWSLESKIRFHINANHLEIEDRVTNLGDQSAAHQLLYHINIGTPILEEGARLEVPYSTIVPKTPRAEEGIDQFDTYDAPQTGFAEQVYLMQLHSNETHWARALLRNKEQTTGLGVEYDTSSLPYFVQWKNTGGLRDGYVTGLEPATNFPNTRGFESQHDRVVPVAAQASQTYRLKLHLLSGEREVRDYSQSIHALRSEDATISKQMRSDWCE